MDPLRPSDEPRRARDLQDAEDAAARIDVALLSTRTAERAHAAQALAFELAPLARAPIGSMSPAWDAIPVDPNVYPLGAFGDELLFRNVAALERARAETNGGRAQSQIDQRLAKLNGAIDARLWTAAAPERLARALEESRMNDRLAPALVRAPDAVRMHEHVGALAIPTMEAADALAQLAPVVGNLLALFEATTGHSLLGLGERIDEEDRALQAVLCIGPLAGELLGKTAIGAARIAWLARETGRTAVDVEAVLHVARQLEADRALLRDAMTARRAGAALNDAQLVALERARGAVTTLALPESTIEGRAVKPEQAANAKEVAPYVGTKADPERPPPGYQIRKGSAGFSVQRIIANDALHARLSADALGTIRWGFAERTSQPGALAKALGAKPTLHEAHHLVPDEIVRSSRLFREAIDRRVFNPDAPSNGAWLPKTHIARVESTRALPLHNGSHPLYNAKAQKVADDVAANLERKLGSLTAASNEDLDRACREVQAEMREELSMWIAENGERLR